MATSSKEQDEAVLLRLAQHPRSFGLDKLVKQFDGIIPKRTLQRRLAFLVAEGKVIREGKARAVRYSLAVEPDSHSPVKPVSNETNVSKASEEIRQALQRPAQQRKPIGHERAFLESYRPNVSAYLSPSVREQLHWLGRTAEEDRPAGTYARNILQQLLVDLSWASSHLEGNTYSLLDTRRLIELGQAAEGKDAAETQMILNHKRAIEYLVDEAQVIEVRPMVLRNLHAILSDNLLADPSAHGTLRKNVVAISGSVYVPLAVPPLIEELFQILADTARAIRDPFEQAFFLMVHIPYLQPFEDVNKRVSRLAANIPLIRENLHPLSFVDVSQRDYVDGILGVYELNRVDLLRDVFVSAYERSCARYVALRASLGEPNRFRMRFRDQLSQLVRDVVVAKVKPAAMRGFVTSHLKNLGIPDEHKEQFVRMALLELENLHEGNFARHGLRPREFEAWRMPREPQG